MIQLPLQLVDPQKPPPKHRVLDASWTPTRLPNSRSMCTSHVTGQTPTTSKIGCISRRNSGVTRNCEVPRNIKPRTAHPLRGVLNVEAGVVQRFWYGWKM